jgi:hypothetical protein
MSEKSGFAIHGHQLLDASERPESTSSSIRHEEQSFQLVRRYDAIWATEHQLAEANEEVVDCTELVDALDRIEHRLLKFTDLHERICQ